MKITPHGISDTSFSNLLSRNFTLAFFFICMDFGHDVANKKNSPVISSFANTAELNNE